MGKPVLYCLDLSPPVRAVLLTAAAIGLDLELKNVNLISGEHLDEAYLKLNPQHTIPTLDDNGDVIWDSHAICTYLISKYGKDDKLYPKDLFLRAKVDQRLHFDSGILFPSLRVLAEGIFSNGMSVIPEENIKKVEAAYKFVECFLQNGDQYLVGNQLTVADFCCVATLTSLPGVVPHDEEKYPKMVEWINRLKTLPYYENNNCGADKLVKVLADKLIANQAAATK